MMIMMMMMTRTMKVCFLSRIPARGVDSGVVCSRAEEHQAMAQEGCDHRLMALLEQLQETDLECESAGRRSVVVAELRGFKDHTFNTACHNTFHQEANTAGNQAEVRRLGWFPCY